MGALRGPGQGEPGEQAPAGQHGRPPEEAGVLAVQTQVLDGDGPGALAHDGDVVRVPAKGADMGFHPAKGGELVVQAKVPVPAVLGLYLFMGEIPQRPHPVVGEDRHGPPLGQGAAIEGALPVEAGVEAAAVEEQDHRGSLGPVGGVNIQVQAVLGIGEV